MDHAIVQCYKNAKLYYNSDRIEDISYDKKSIYQKNFKRINDINNGEYNELLIKLDEVLDKL